MRQRLAQPPRNAQRRQRDKQRANKQRIGQRPSRHVGLRLAGSLQKHQTRHQLHRQAKSARHPARLPQPGPESARAFQRPNRRRPARIERQRHGQRGKADANRRQAFDQQALAAGLAPRQQQRRCQIQRRKAQRRKRRAKLILPHQPGLQAKADQGRAKHQHAIDRAAEPRRRVARIQHGGQQVNQHKQQQKELRAGVVLGLVFQNAPRRGDAKGGDKTHGVQNAPGALPGDEQDRQIQHRVIAEQRDMAAAPGREQQRHGKTTGKSGDGQRAGILQQRQRAAQRANDDHQAKGQPGGHQRVQPERGKHRQIQHRHAAALQRQRKVRPRLALAKADGQQRQRRRADNGQPQLDRKQPGHRRIAHQKRQADEQNHQPHAHDGVAAQQPVSGGGKSALERVGFVEFGRRFGIQARRSAGGFVGVPRRHRVHPRRLGAGAGQTVGGKDWRGRHDGLAWAECSLRLAGGPCPGQGWRRF